MSRLLNHKPRGSSTFILLLAPWVLPFLAGAAPISVVSSADTFVAGGSTNASAGLPDKNYGAAGALMISPPATAKGELQTLLRFDFSAVKASFDTTYGVGGWTISSVTLQLGTNVGTQGAQSNNAVFNSINAGIFKIDWLTSDDWTEGTGSPSAATTDGITYNGLASLVGLGSTNLGSFTYTPVGNTNPPSIPPSTYALGLDGGFVADAAAGNLVSLRAYAGDTGVGYLFNSKTFGTAANRPTLLVDAVPEPSTLGFLGLSGLAIWGIFRRKTSLPDEV